MIILNIFLDISFFRNHYNKPEISDTTIQNFKKMLYIDITLKINKSTHSDYN